MGGRVEHSQTCTSHLYNNRGGHIFAIPGVVIKVI
ncbi:unnamed protein product, partial [Ectocarpus sp. 12 AP-2014]